MTKTNPSKVLKAFTKCNADGIPLFFEKLLPEAERMELHSSGTRCEASDVFSVSHLIQADLSIQVEALWDDIELRIAALLKNCKASDIQRTKGFKDGCLTINVAYHGSSDGILSMIFCERPGKATLIQARIQERLK